jgi:hypothetical protein
MNEREKPLAELIDEAFDKINSFEGGNTLFYKRFHKSRAVVSTWKSGKVQPTQSDVLKFIKVSNEVIKECKAEFEKRNQEQIVLMDEFTGLISA